MLLSRHNCTILEDQLYHSNGTLATTYRYIYLSQPIFHWNLLWRQLRFTLKILVCARLASGMCLGRGAHIHFGYELHRNIPDESNNYSVVIDHPWPDEEQFEKFEDDPEEQQDLAESLFQIDQP